MIDLSIIKKVKHWKALLLPCCAVMKLFECLNNLTFCFALVLLIPTQDEDFVTRDDFEDADQLRIGNDGIFMLTFFSMLLNLQISVFLFSHLTDVL